MELSRRKVPLYGQAKVFALLDGLDSMPEDAEVFIVLEGSTLVHVTRAQSDVMLCFIVPGHNLAEVVSVQAYLSSESTPLTWVGGAMLEYVQDDAQDLAEHLVTRGHSLNSLDHTELSSLFNLGQQSSRWAMDRRVALAMANLDIPPNWNILGTPSRDDGSPKDSLLHLAVRWGLCRLAELLLCQPGGLMAVNVPNEDGVTPLQLAYSSGNGELLQLLLHPPNPLATPPAGLSQVWADRSRLLRYCHDTGNLTLTVRQNLKWSSEESRHADIQLLRNRLGDEGFLREIKALRRERTESVFGKEQLVDEPAENGPFADKSGDNSAADDNDYEEPLMFCLNQEDQEDERSDSEKSQSTGESQTSSPTLAAAARLSAMIHGKDRVYANAVVADQADDVDVKYRSGLSPDVGSLCWDPFSTISPDWRTCPRNDERAVRSQKSKESPLRVSPPPSFPSSPLASAFRLFEGGQRRRPRSSFPVSPTLNGGRCNLPLAAAHGLSPSLECDSGEEDLLGRSYPCSAPTLQSGLPDLKPSQKLSKKPEEGEVRLRSYSYSSAKARPSRPSLNRDATITDLAEEQSVLNLSETSKEKRVLGFRKRAQSAEEESGASLQHLTLSEFLKEMEDEEWDKYIVPSKVESEKYKVSRTFSFLKSRMSSTRGKTKVKGKEVKDGKDKNRGVNGHQFAPASPSAPAVCVACDKSICGKDALQCSNCLVNVHKNCRDSVAQCGKKLQEKNVSLMKSKNLSLPQTSAKDLVSTSPVASSSVPSSLSLTPTTKEKSETLKPLSKSLSASLESRRPSDTAAMEVDSVPPSYGSQPDEGAPLPASLPSVVSQDDVVAPLLSDLSADLLGLDVESWSLAVSPDFCRQHDRRAVKRQDVIYELMQTELHHIQTLTVMSEVFRRGMLEELQLGWDCVARIFPCLDSLLLFHRNLFGSLQERRQAASQADNPRNYLISQIGDVLLQQFSDGNAETMKRVYGDFCSHHLEAVSVFKELQQHNKKLQIFVKQQSNNLLVRRREIPEFILLVTQRITKYPVLLERILHYTQEGSQEHTDLSSALAGIRDIIGAVDLTVSEYERSQELREVLARLENKSFAKLKSGKVIRKQDLHSKHRHLRHKGLLYWKTATGRLKDTLALLLTDVVVILQEKDQRFVFAAVDQKPPVIPLQKLIVREVANEERGMFLISASSAGPEMYEVHTSTREERNAWMRHIRQAVESCPEEEEEEEEEEQQQQQQQQRSTETEEAKRAAEVKVQKISKFQETLFIQDQRICTSLEEKLQLYAELTELTLRSPEAIPHRHLLVQAELDSESPRPASTLLAAALREAENLIRILQVHDGERDNSPVRGCECPNYNSHGSSIQESPSEPDYLSTLSMSSTSLGSDSEGTDGISWSEEPKQSHTEETLFKVAESVQSLTQLLYSLQAAVTLQDSCLEIQKILLQEGDQSQLKSLASLQNTLETAVEKRKEDVEKKATERKKEEVDEVHKLHVKLKLEQQRWDKKCVARDKRQTEQEGALEQRERHCILEAQRLRCERQELETQLMEYRHSLDRLRDGQESVDREKEKLRAQQCLLQSWRHNRQSSLPVTIPLDEYEVPIHSRSGSLDGSCWTYEKDAALLASLQKKQQQQHLLSGPRQSSTFGGADLSLSASLYNSLNTLLSQTHRKHSQDALTLGEKNHGRDQPLDTSANPFADRGTAQPQSVGKYLSPQSEGRSPRAWRPEMPGQELSQDAYSSSSPSLTPLLPQQSYLSLEGHLREDASEENIVYL
ncbi:rho guanine nucleotide exchange factor 28 isoform X3 [Syngnathus scovelli]|uniref:rho guanine nucleotide exchange factor 28 isoform X3 n=1 Tax=Syngnathus scovelli TaxID=161590 RepID=UPI00210F9C02|nr:rho guanine nucleotide exchange factor 28 isoform X3 [Syngnathus scovelli]